MDNSKIAKKFDLLAKLMELYDDNPFKIRSYAQAYAVLRKVEKPFDQTPRSELESIPGVGSTIADKIIEMVETGTLKALDSYLAKTPPGVIDMLQIRGFGPKKVKQIWKELEVETIGELLYACNENRIASLKGFGMKTQEELIKLLQYSESSRGKYLYSKAEKAGYELITLLEKEFSGHLFSIVGELSLHLPVVKGIEMVTTLEDFSVLEELPNIILNDGIWYAGIQVFLFTSSKKDFIWDSFTRTCSEEFLNALNVVNKGYTSEKEIFEKNGYPYISAARRDKPQFLQVSQIFFQPLHEEQLKGTIHHHTTFSDGLHSVLEMQQKASQLGYDYMILTDHSQSAFYANGLKPETLLTQWAEIDKVNGLGKGCYLFKGIESDILGNGELDYPEDILAQFDCIIASIHSNLRMDVEKATSRLVKAVEHPRTKILGHPTGRLLLSRPGYPVHMDYVLDACAANGVAIELNANPQRLDIDHSFHDLVIKKNVLLSINPDAHSADAIQFTRYGIKVAQKSNFNPERVINTWDLSKMKQWLSSH